MGVGDACGRRLGNTWAILPGAGWNWPWQFKQQTWRLKQPIRRSIPDYSRIWSVA